MGRGKRQQVADLVSGYNIIEKLGIGARSQIYQVSKPDTHEVYALKRVIRDEHEDTRFLDQAITEFEGSSKFNHPTLRRSLECKRFRKWMKLSEVQVIMEFVNGVTLEKRRSAAAARVGAAIPSERTDAIKVETKT